MRERAFRKKKRYQPGFDRCDQNRIIVAWEIEKGNNDCDEDSFCRVPRMKNENKENGQQKIKLIS